MFAAAASVRKRRSPVRVLVPVAGLALAAGLVVAAYGSAPEQPLYEIRQALSSIGLADTPGASAEKVVAEASENVELAEAAILEGRSGAALGRARLAIVGLDQARRLLDEDGDEGLATAVQALELRAFAAIAAALEPSTDPDERNEGRRNRGAGGRNDRSDGRQRERDKRDKRDEQDRARDRAGQPTEDPAATPADESEERPGDPGSERGDEGDTRSGTARPTPTPRPSDRGQRPDGAGSPHEENVGDDYENNRPATPEATASPGL